VRNNFSVKDAARLLGCSPSQVYKLFEEGELRGYRIGRKIRIYEDALESFQAGHENYQAADVTAVTLAKPIMYPQVSLDPAAARLLRHLGK
jgi:excisionase family DNA binding protein